MASVTTAITPRQTQMNTRIDAALKEAGDAVLARLGYTPSIAVRGLWRFVVDHSDDADAVREVIEPEVASALSDEGKRRVAATAGLRSLYAQTNAELGICTDSATGLPSWDELRDAWYDARQDEEA